MNIIRVIEEEQKKTDDYLKNIQIGYTVKVFVKVKEGTRERLQAFEGIIIAKKGSGLNEAFTVRKISNGVGVERVFPVHSPNVDRVEFIRKGKASRAKLYYLRGRTGKAAKLKNLVH
jgi:large subunit ribosomal protein L19